MAVIDKNKKNQATTTDATEGSQENTKGKVVDILQDKSLLAGSKMTLAVKDGKPTEDAWEFAAPPDAGKYNLNIRLAKEAVKMYKLDDAGDYTDDNISYSVYFQCTLTDEKFGNVTVWPSVSTRIPRGKNISTAAGFLWKLGYKVPAEVDHRTLAKTVVQAIMKEPSLDAQLDWHGWSKELQREVARKQTDFPYDAKSQTYQHIFDRKTKDGGTEEIKAQLKVEHWFGKKDDPSEYESKKGPGGTGTGRGTGPVLMRPASEDLVEAEELAETTTNTVTNNADDDLLAALEE